MRIRALVLTAVTAVSVLAAAGAAQAAPYAGGNYPALGYEGKYPEQTPCRYAVQQSQKATYKGQTITLRLFYNGRCGAFARIDNAPQGCTVTLWRTQGVATTAAAADQAPIGSISEPIDPGINFAYTQVADNLGGRSAQALLACGGGPAIARTNWY
jgi:hypothetical protein